MWANSWASTASICCGDISPSIAAGSSSTGRSQPITAGTSTTVDWNIRTGRLSCIRSISSASRRANGSLPAVVPRYFSRCKAIHPPKCHTDKTNTPKNQANTSHGTQGETACETRSDSGVAGSADGVGSGEGWPASGKESHSVPGVAGTNSGGGALGNVALGGSEFSNTLSTGTARGLPGGIETAATSEVGRSGTIQ